MVSFIFKVPKLIVIQLVLQVVTYRPVTVLVTQRIRERMRGTVITENKKSGGCRIFFI